MGTWDMHGRTLDSEVENVTGRATFESLPGGFFLQQRSRLRFGDPGNPPYDIGGSRARA
jgi:hypothetical protein